ncbi:MAG: serine/threonine-protein kinase, partial [Planctomycetaceae bacterium]
APGPGTGSLPYRLSVSIARRTMDRMSKRPFGPFDLESKLGLGGMGVVYLATYRKDGRQVALKVLAPELSSEAKLLARFEREMEILKKLRHPRIVHYHGGGREKGRQFYIMELMKGGTVAELLRERGRLPWERVIEYGLQICEGLQHAHAHGVVHRDLKPANLFLAEDGALKLGDFGIARDLEATALTATGRTLGTYAYMAPEQFTGKPPVGPKTDLYALGCVLFEMLTGHAPFQAATQPEMMVKHLDEQPPRVTADAIDCPVWLETVVLRLLEKDPANRYHDALAVQAALEEVGQKIAEGASVSQQLAGGGATAVGTRESTLADRSQLRNLLGKKRRKKRKQGPFYERAWFLGCCLLLLVGIVVWAMRPLNEGRMFARADELMQSDDLADWQFARTKYLEPLLARYPDGEHAEAARRHIERIDVELADRQARTALRFNRDPATQAQRMYIEGLKAEAAQDRISALDRYRGLVALFQDDRDQRPYVVLAERRMNDIRAAANDPTESRELVAEALRRADEHVDRGERFEAEVIWRGIEELFRNNQEYQSQVRQARARLAEGDTETDDDPRAADPEREERG